MLNNSGPILIVDDNKLEALLVERSITKLEIDKKVDHANNGLEAIEYLKQSPHPSLILLDVNMPIMNGFDFLRERNNSPELLKIPTIVFCSSEESGDKEEALKLGACGHMVKPIVFDDMTRMLKSIIEYWSLSRAF